MPLKLIVGPPNSGRAGRVRAWIEAMARDMREPILVVPTEADARRFERELAGLDSVLGAEPPGEPALGFAVLSFDGLFGEIARSLEAPHRASAGRAQREAIVRRALRSTRLGGPLGRSAARPGFAIELERLIGELQGAFLDPAGMLRDAEGNPVLTGLARLFASYCRERDALGRGDARLVAEAAIGELRERPQAWGGRPVAFYGFDDMTRVQLELVRRLADAAEVIATVTYEDREALSERARLRRELIEDCGGEIEVELGRNPRYTDSEALRRLERELFAEQPGSGAPEDGGLVLLESAGRRGQAEQIAIEIARLIDEGERPDDVAIALRSPERDGPLLAAVLDSNWIPVALQARLPLGATAVGRGVLGLLRAALPGADAADLLAFLRAPGAATPGEVDGFELELRRRGIESAAAAAELWSSRQESKAEGKRRPLRELEALTASGTEPKAKVVAEVAVRAARALSERSQQRSDRARDERLALELRAAAAAAEALGEVAELGFAGAPLEEAVATLESLTLPAVRGSGEGRVLITGPYEIRARRVPNLFVASLQEGEFPSVDPGDPLLLDRDRGILGLPGRAQHDAEERYLFYTCVSRPTRRLFLCWRVAEEDGSAAARSPFVDEVARAFDPAGLGSERLERLVRRRGLDRLVPLPEEATTPRALERALAAAGPPAEERRPGPLSSPAVLERLRERQLFGASTLEEWLSCPYKWFVRHELKPRPLGPEPEPLTQGGLAHSVLESLYRERPAGSALPKPASLAEWVRRAGELTEELADRHGLGGGRPSNAAARARVEAMIAVFLRREASMAAERRLVPSHFEAGFGEDEEDARPPLRIGDFGIHGKIDRIDLAPGEEAGAIFDYKTSREVSIGEHLCGAEAIAKHGKLQPGLYAIALRELWESEPIAALYQPLGATSKPEPRGILRSEKREELLGGIGVSAEKRGDNLDQEGFEAALAAASEAASKIVAEMRQGLIRREPLGGDCGYCEYASVCRIERAARLEPEEPDREEEDGG